MEAAAVEVDAEPIEAMEHHLATATINSLESQDFLPHKTQCHECQGTVRLKSLMTITPIKHIMQPILPTELDGTDSMTLRESIIKGTRIQSQRAILSTKNPMLEA